VLKISAGWRGPRRLLPFFVFSIALFLYPCHLSLVAILFSSGLPATFFFLPLLFFFLPLSFCFLLNLEHLFAFALVGNAHRNTIVWSSHGRFVCLAGFGNLAGGILFLDWMETHEWYLVSVDTLSRLLSFAFMDSSCTDASFVWKRFVTCRTAIAFAYQERWWPTRVAKKKRRATAESTN